MIITITPDDLVKRCLWNNFNRFCLKDESQEDKEKLLEKNQPFSLSEDDAYVIGLLKIVETDNIIHRFKQDINEIIRIKSTLQKIDDEQIILINKSTIINDCLNFKNNFPEYYNNDVEFKDKISELNEFINSKVKEIDGLKQIEIYKNIKGTRKKFTYISSKEANKLFKLTKVDE
jgi:hypothetical protein